MFNRISFILTTRPPLATKESMITRCTTHAFANGLWLTIDCSLVVGVLTSVRSQWITQRCYSWLHGDLLRTIRWPLMINRPRSRTEYFVNVWFVLPYNTHHAAAFFVNALVLIKLFLVHQELSKPPFKSAYSVICRKRDHFSPAILIFKVGFSCFAVINCGFTRQVCFILHEAFLSAEGSLQIKTKQWSLETKDGYDIPWTMIFQKGNSMLR